MHHLAYHLVYACPHARAHAYTHVQYRRPRFVHACKYTRPWASRRRPLHKRTHKRTHAHAQEGEALKTQLADVVKAKAEIAEAHAVMQAEFAIFKQQANMPKQVSFAVQLKCRPIFP